VTDTKQAFLTKLFSVDPASDLVFFRMSGKGFPTVNFVQEDALAIGQELFLLGRQATTTAIEPHQALLTALRTYRLIDRSYFLRSSDRLTEIHQTDYPSIAGSPYFTVGGELVGVATGTQADMIPAAVLASALERFASTGAISRNVLGVRAIDLSMAKGLLIAPATAGTEGAYIAGDASRNVAAITPKSPAERAGLQAGDVILKVGDQTVSARQPLSALIQAAGIRSSMNITYRRDGKEQTVPITLEVAKS
jgi:S1-C subfamily serine protease